MKIDEAIKHCEEVAEENEKTALYKPIDFCVTGEIDECTKCAAEHRQLAEWLKELKQLREQTRWISVSERLPEKYGMYICTIKFNHKDDYPDEEIHTVEYVKAYGRWDMEQFFSDCNPRVIAWMPLPLPYKQEVEG